MRVCTTNVFGRYFISYRRSSSADVDTLQVALHDIGLPTWRDVTNLPYGRSPQEIEAVLAAEDTAGAVLYATPDIGDSEYVQNLEAPAIFRRADDDFVIVPIAARGLAYEGIATLFSGKAGIHRLNGWNMELISADQLHEIDARRIATRLLTERLRRIARLQPSDITVELSTRVPIPFSCETALAIDHRRFFPSRLPTNWPDVHCALATIQRALMEYLPSTRVILSGYVGLPYALAWGTMFSVTAPVSGSWKQRRQGVPDEIWSLQPQIETNYSIETVRDEAAAGDIALLLSVTDDVEPAFAASRDSIRFNSIVSVKAPDDSPLCSSPASGLIYAVTNAVRRARRTADSSATLHIFAAAPAGLMFLLGQMLNTFAAVQTYEYVGGRYAASLTLHP